MQHTDRQFGAQTVPFNLFSKTTTMVLWRLVNFTNGDDLSCFRKATILLTTAVRISLCFSSSTKNSRYARIHQRFY